MQRRSSMPLRTPTISVPQGSRIVNHGPSHHHGGGNNSSAAIITIFPPPPPPNGMAPAYMGQSQSSTYNHHHQAASMQNVAAAAGAAAFRQGMPSSTGHQVAPPPHYAPFPSYGLTHEMMPPGSVYVPTQQAAYFQPPSQAPFFTTQYGGPIANSQYITASYTNGGQAFAYPANTGYPGPSAMELEAPPAIAAQPPPPQPQPLPPMIHHQQQQHQQPLSSGNMNLTGPPVQLQTQGQPPPPPHSVQQQRTKTILAVIDPQTGVDKMEDLRKEQQQHPQMSNTHRYGLWKPSVEQQQQMYTQLSTGAVLPSSSGAGAMSSSLEQQQIPSRSGGATPRLEQQSKMQADAASGQPSLSPAQSPAPDVARKDNTAVLSEFLSQFSQRLASPDHVQQQPKQQESHHPLVVEDAVIMPPPAGRPPSRNSAAATTRTSSTPPPTPPAASTPIQSTTTASNRLPFRVRGAASNKSSFVDFTVGRSSGEGGEKTAAVPRFIHAVSWP